ncbi:MAG: nuclear transport factor 2 family protein [Selenomonadaceae bacterium]|nr:nuclear transport factor 2 family protein [Selenomonadaceae bacterium]
MATIKDYEEIRKVAQMYIDGGNGDSSIMKPAFHKNATINGEPIQTLFDGVDKAGETNSKAIVDVLDVVNDVAVIRITMENWHGVNFVDFHLLKKDTDGWKIIAKVYTETK